MKAPNGCGTGAGIAEARQSVKDGWELGRRRRWNTADGPALLDGIRRIMTKQSLEGERNGEGDGIATMSMSWIMEAAPFRWFFGRSCRNLPRTVFGHAVSPELHGLWWSVYSR
jgi:hypothetical protein